MKRTSGLWLTVTRRGGGGRIAVNNYHHYLPHPAYVSIQLLSIMFLLQNDAILSLASFI